MSCLGIDYNPVPPRAWSRVENKCSQITDSSGTILSPLTGTYVPLGVYYEDAQMISKGNILQYKKNSSSLTKKQRYSQIAKGMWTNRTKTWASQSEKYTNPNTSSLRRVNYVVLPLPIGVEDPFGCPNITTYFDGGNLICNQVVNPCTNEVIETIPAVPNCYPSSDSDVPGKITPLCWNNRIATWYPRQRLTMNNSTDKWPQNYKLFKSAVTIPTSSSTGTGSTTKGSGTTTKGSGSTTGTTTTGTGTGVGSTNGIININSDNYTISKITTYTVSVLSTITLSGNFTSGQRILIINLTNQYIPIQTQNHEKIYHSLHSPNGDSNTIHIGPKLSGEFLYINNNTTKFWNVNLC